MPIQYPLFKRFKNGGFHLWYVDALSGKLHLMGTFGPTGKLTAAEYSFSSRKVKVNGPDWKHLQKTGDIHSSQNPVHS